MKRLSLETYDLTSRTSTLRWRGPAIAVIPLAVLWFLPALLTLNVVKWDAADHWDDYDAFWNTWHEKYDRFQTRDGKHKLNGISLPSEWPHATQNAVCTCGFSIVNGTDDGLVLRAFQAHLNASEPTVLDLASNL